MRGLLATRAATTLVAAAGITTVEGFVAHLRTSTAVTRPVAHLLIASHGNDHGWMEVDLDAETPPTEQASRTDPDELIAAAASGSVALGTTVPSPNTVCHLRGCRVGQDRRFLELWGQALGGGVPVTAPRFFHLASDQPGIGAFEAFGYDWEIRRLQPFAGRAAVVTGFRDAGFTFYDGTPVPATAWGQWIPRRIAEGDQDTEETVPLGETIGGIDRLTFERTFRYEIEQFRYTITYPGAAATGEQALKDFEAAIRTDPSFATTAPYPTFARYDQLGATNAARVPCTDVSQWLAAFEWTCAPARRGSSELVCTGRRHAYTVGPVVRRDPGADPPGTALLFNFLPAAGTSHAAITHALETDARFFVTVP